MKKYLLFAIIIINFSLFAQDTWYYVIQVKGVVINASTKKTIKAGDKLRSIDKIDFKDANGVIKVINPDEGIYNLSPAYSKKRGKEFQYLVKAVMSPLLGSTRVIFYKKSIDFGETVADDVLGDSALYFGPQELEIYPWRGQQGNDDKYLFEYTYKGKLYSDSLSKVKETLQLYTGLENVLNDDIKGPLGINAQIIRMVNNKRQIYRSFRLIIPEKQSLINEINMVVRAMRESGKEAEEIDWVIGETLKINYPNCNYDWSPFGKWLKENTEYK